MKRNDDEYCDLEDARIRRWDRITGILTFAAFAGTIIFYNLELDTPMFVCLLSLPFFFVMRICSHPATWNGGSTSGGVF